MNKKNNIFKALINFGLLENEVIVYYILLENKALSILDISKKTNIKRTTVYQIIEKLKNKGLIKINIKNSKKLISAENPEVLEKILEEKKENINNVLDDLKSLYSNNNNYENKIEYFEGIESVKNIYRNILNNLNIYDDYLVLGNQKSWINLDKNFFQNFIEKRAKKNIKIRLIFTDSDISRKFKKYEKNYNQNIKILSPETELTTNLIITPKKIVIHQLVEPISAIVIENKNIVKMHKEQFELIWKSLK